MIIAIIAVF